MVATYENSPHSGQPGTWTQLGKGPTSVANNTIVSVIINQSMAAGEIPVFHFGMKTTPTTNQRHHRIKGVDVAVANCTGMPKKKSGTGLWNFEIKHNDGAARDFDWQVLKVLPA